MDFLDSILGEQGCSVEGTLSSNPVSQLLDRIFDSHLGTDYNLNADTIYSLNNQMDQQSYPTSINDFNTQDPLNFPTDQYNDFNGQLLNQDMIQNNMLNQNMIQNAMYQQMILSSYMQGQFNSNPNVKQNSFQKSKNSKINSKDYPASSSSSIQREKLTSTIKDYNEIWNNQSKAHYSVSKEAYQEAWNSLSNTLEESSSDYIPRENNPYQDSKDYFEIGMNLYREGNIDQAIYAFEAATRDDIENSEAWSMLGSCHSEQDDDKKAITCFMKATEYDPYNLNALLALGTSYVNEMNYIKALETLRQWATHNPKFYGLSIPPDNYSDESLFEQVRHLLLETTKWAPEDVDSKVVLGVFYNVSQDYQNAIKYFRDALNFAPQDYSIWNKLGATMANNDQSQEALNVYSKALELRPKYARALINRGIAETNLGNFSQAVKEFVNTLQTTPTASHIWGYLRIVFTSMRRHDLVEATNSNDLNSLLSKLDF